MGDFVSPLKKKLIEEARARFEEVSPCGNRSDLLDCFTVHDDRLALWFNTAGNTTHIIMVNIENPALAVAS